MQELAAIPSLAVQRRAPIPNQGSYLWADLFEPATPIGWIVLTRSPGDRLDRFFSDEVARRGLEAGWATLILEATTSKIERASEHLRIATTWLQSQPEARGLPLVYLGTGQTAAVALHAATRLSVNSVLTWNGRPELAWTQLRAVTAPSLLMVNDQSSRLTRWLNQLAQRQMGSASKFMVTTAASPLNAAALGWLQHQPRRRSRPSAFQPRLVSVGQRLATSALVVAALGLPLTSSVAAQTSALNFNDSVAVNANQVKGDGVGATQANGLLSPLEALFADSLTLKANHVKGDGLRGPNTTGAQTLIDSHGLKFFVNTSITFNTSSSASGAASEASFTAAVPATTTLGGTVAATLTDMFDGYNALCLSLNGATGPCVTASPDYIVYNNNGAATLECAGVISPTVNRQVVLNSQDISGTLSVSRKVFVPDNDEFIRWLNIVTNTTGSPQTVSLSSSNNLGSDSNTTVFDSSTGVTGSITSIVNAPYWVGTFQNYSGSTSSDPRIGHVLFGPNATVGLSSINFVDGDDNPFWAFNLTLAPGETQIIMTFATGQPSKAAAVTKAAELVNLPDNALQCMSATERAQVVNFNTTYTLFLPLIQR